ncbi:MAG: sugar ABC transporter permease [Oscillospiraceae bacterium]|nr:sugar ABC transporter permease [Oscillospiraceae bacterium]
MKNTIAVKGQTKLMTPRQRYWMNIWKHREFYLFCLPGIICALIFQYYPMYGVLMAFKKVGLGQTVQTGEWTGLENFAKLFRQKDFRDYLWNTININFSLLIFSFPAPLLLAVMMHNSPSHRLKAITQTCTYLPHLLSMVVIISLLNTLLNNSYGLVNILLKNMGKEKIFFFEEKGWYKPLYIGSSIWAACGYSAIVYLASLSSVDGAITEAATIDGANKLQRMWHIDLKLIMPTIVTMLLLNLGTIMGAASMEKVLLLQNQVNLRYTETIATFVYKRGVLGAEYGFSTAVSLFNTACNLLMLFTSNWVAKKVTKTSLF